MTAAEAHHGDPLRSLLDHLDLAPLGGDRFEARAGGGMRRLFGGLIAAQSAVAAAHTVEGPRLHSLHGYFLRPGRPGVPLRFEVVRLRDGRSFATRRVVALQHGEAIFELAASFTAHEEGVAHAFEPPPEAVPAPEGLPDWETLRPLETGEGPRPPDAIEVRVCEPADDRPGARPPPHRTVWMRPRGTPPEDPTAHAALLVYASDRTLLRTAARLHGALRERLPASLDHAVWLHRPARFDDWILYATESPIASGGRAWVVGRMLSRRGERLATVTQEGLLRRPRAARQG
ncbi:MAG TPA: acyl-CoA thioesterase domain-containing protein [Myxococcota bacterium]|nr:acyl-CoA thioesterase domain-containing protein [Myxococcota bacterium]